SSNAPSMYCWNRWTMSATPVGLSKASASAHVESGHHVGNEQLQRLALALEAHVAVEPEAVLVVAQFLVAFQARDHLPGLTDHQILADRLAGVLREHVDIDIRQRLDETLLDRPLVLEPFAEIAVKAREVVHCRIHFGGICA